MNNEPGENQDEEQRKALETLVDDLDKRFNTLSTIDRKYAANASVDEAESQMMIAYDNALKRLEEQRDRHLERIRIYRETQLDPKSVSSPYDDQADFLRTLVQKCTAPAVESPPDLAALKTELEALKSRIDKIEPDEIESASSEIDAMKAKIKEAEKLIMDAAFNGVYAKFTPNNLAPLECTQVGKLELGSDCAPEIEPVPKKIELTLKFSHKFELMDRFFVFYTSNKVTGLSTEQRFRCWDLKEKTYSWDFISNEGSACAMILLTSIFIATGHENGGIRIWDGTKMGPIKKLEGHGNSKVHALVALPTGKLASAADQDHRIIIWDPFLEDSDTRLLTLRQGSVGSTVSSLGLLSNGFLVSHSTGLDKSLIEIWNVNNGELVQQLKVAQTKMLPLVVLSNDHVALASISGDIKVYDVVEKSLVSSWDNDEPLAKIWSMQRLRGDRLILGRDFNTKTSLEIVDPARGELIQTIPMANISTGEYFIFMSPFSDSFVISHANGLFEVWDYADSE